MNEQAIQDSYNLFVQNGYNKSIDEFKKLIASNTQALDDSYNLFVQNGYKKPIEDYKALMGLSQVAPAVEEPVKKKVGPLPAEKVQDFTEFPSAVGPSVSPEPTKPVAPIDETPKEKPFFTGKFGAALEVMDLVSPFGVGDFIDDMGRAVDAGRRQGAVVTPSNQLMVSGKYASPETIQKFVTASKAMQNAGPSDEMMNYQKIYEEEGKGIFGVLKGLVKNPGAIPELIMSSYTAMVNPTSLASAGTVVGGAAAGGALFGGVGAAPAAIASAPYAMAAAGTTLETGLTFSELLQDKLNEKGLDFTEENVKKILEDDKALSEIRVKSAARGATIGIIDAMTGRLAGKVGAKMLGNTAASKVKAGLAGGGIEGVGGSVGEAAGRIVAGQPLDVSEIALEGISETPSAAIDIVSEVMKKPVYKVNGENRTEADIEEILRVGTPDDISKMNIEIKNDNKGYNNKIQDVVVTNQIRKEVKEANPDIDEESLNTLVELEKELKKFENNKTQSGKDKAAAIRSQIKTIQENAIQEQATGEVPVQSGAGVSETLEEGEPQAEPQVTTTEGVEEVITPEEEVKIKEREELRNKKIEEDYQRSKLSDEVFYAQKRIGSADDVEAAIEEYNKAKKNLEDFDETVRQRRDKIRAKDNLEYIIYDETASSEKYGYQYKELYDQDPRLAALQSSKDLLKWVESGESEKNDIERGRSPEEAKQSSQDLIESLKQDIADLEADLKDNPVVSSKTQEVVSPQEEVIKVYPELKDTKATDETGKPLLVYHGGLSFDDFNPSQTKEDKGIYFTDNRDFALYFAHQAELVERDRRGDDYSDIPEELLQTGEPFPEKYFKYAKVHEAYLDMKNPTIVDAIDARAIPKNYEPNTDGFIAKSTGDFGYKGGQYVVFNPNQIKKVPVMSSKTQEIPEGAENSLIESNKNYSNYAGYFRGVSKNDAIKFLINNSVDNSNVPLINDNVISEFLGLTEEEINSLKSEGWDKSSNLTKDFENAKGYGEAVIKVKDNGDIIDFENGYSLGKGLEVEAIYIDGKWYDKVSPVVSSKTQEVPEGMATQLNDLVENFTTAYSQAPVGQTTSEKRTSTAKANKAIKKLNDFFGFTFGSRANEEQASKQDALTNIKSLLDPNSPLSQFANITELINAYNSDKQNNVESQLVKDVDTIFGITPTVSSKTQEVVTPQEEVINVLRSIGEVDVDNYKLNLGGGLSLEVAPIDRGGKPIGNYLIKKDGEVIGNVKLANAKSFYNNFGISEGINENDFVLSDGVRNAINIYDENNRKKGYGTKVYLGLVKLLQSNLNDVSGARIISSPQWGQTIDSYKLWESLYRKGLAKIIGTTAEGGINVKDLTSDSDKEYLKIKGDKREIFIGEDLGMAYEGVPNGLIYNGNIYALDLTQITPQQAVSSKTQEVAPVIEVEQYVPITEESVSHDKFTRDNAVDYETDFKTGDNGREYEYISRLSVSLNDEDGNSIGNLVKIVDEDGVVSWNAEDENGTEVGRQDFDTKAEAQKALIEKANKIRKKEFDREAKILAKAAEKEAAKKAKAAEKAAAKKPKPTAPAVPEEGPTAEDIASIDAMLDLDVEDEDNMQKILNALDRGDNAIGRTLRGGAFDSLLAIPLSTVQVVIKALKVLVKGGMKLRDAIRKVAADNNISQDSVKDILNISPIQDGFNELMGKVDEMIQRQTARGTEQSRMTSNVDTLVRNSEVYQNASDAQKKIMEREARGKMGVSSRRAPSIGRILGALKDITNVSRKDKLKIISEIRKLSKDAANDLAKEIKALADTGKITVKQAANIIARFGKVNMLNEVSVSKFVDYMTKVFNDAEYAQKISEVNSKLKSAKKNIVSKIGIADGLMVPLQKLFSINPILIPQKYFDRYAELVNMFGERKAVLTLEEKQKVIKDVNEILDEINAEQSQVLELADRMKSSQNKVEEDGKLDYSKTVKSMLDNKEIDEKEADVMMKYQEEVSEEVEPEQESTEEEKQNVIKQINSSKINADDLPTKDERDLAKNLSKLLNSKNLNRLSVRELNNLLKVIDNINNGYIPHYAQLLYERITALDNSAVLDKAISNAKPIPFSNLYARFKSLFTKNKNFSELIRRNPLYYIDQVFGNFNTKEIFNSLFEKAAEAQAKFAFSEKQIAKRLKEAELKVAKSFNMNANKTTMSKYKMMAYLLQREFESNPNNKQVNPASKFLESTIDHIENGKSSFTERDVEMLREIQEKYSNADGQIDAKKLYDSFNSAEKSAIKEISDINDSMRDNAVYTSAIIRGDKISPLTDYVHHYALLDDSQQEDITGASSLNTYSNTLRPSTRAKSLLTRTGKATPLNFDVFAATQRGAKFVLMDYYLTEPIRTARKTINETSRLLKERKADKKQRDIFNAISGAFDEATENLLTNAFMSTSLADDVVDYISKQGYRAVLASIPRFASELTSNVAFATIVAPKDFSTGVSMKKFIFSSDAAKAVFNLNSKQMNRLFPNHTLSGKMIDTSVMSDAVGVKGSRAKNDVANKMQQIYNLSLGKYTNAVELTADALISTPDKITMRPVWFGAFTNEFKNLTGTNPDFDKIANNDEAYMTENKENLEKATLVADKKSVLMGATDNAFMGILKGAPKPNQSGFIRAFNRFNNFMTTFLIYEYVTARTGIMAAMKGGQISRKQGVALLGGVTARMVLYTLLINVLGSAMTGLFVDDEEEDEKSFYQKIGQALASAFSSMVLGRDFGNVTKTLVNYGVEKVNQEYLDFLREGEYDPYKDAIQYSVLPIDKQGKPEQILFNMMGPFSPSAKTAYLIAKKALEKPKEEEEAIERSEKEKNIRVPLEFFGNIGMVPLYKDIHKIVNAELYKDLEKTKGTGGKGSSMSKEDMKKFFPDMYNDLYGPGGSLYDVEQMKKEINREQEKIKKQIKEDMYR